MTTRKKKRGGARPGAGRPPILSEPVRVTVWLEESTVAVLDELAESRELPLTTYIRDVLERHVRRKR